VFNGNLWDSVFVRAYGLRISTCEVIRSEGLASMLAE